MFIYKSNDERVSIDTEAYYEAIASQEEIYLEEVEEELRAILIFGIFGNPFPPRKELKRSSGTQKLDGSDLLIESRLVGSHGYSDEQMFRDTDCRLVVARIGGCDRMCTSRCFCS